jgi:hypothetical protein
MVSIDKHKTSRLAYMFGSQLRAWANELQSTNATILAISRKGPRLIELLVYEGFLPDTFRKRVISELALPFMQNCQGDLVVIDDSVSNGTTFNKIYKLSTEAMSKWNNPNDISPKIIGLPFAVGEDVKEECLANLKAYFLRLEKGEIASFVNSEAFSFQLLGKPFDLEYPILSVFGNFNDTDKLEKNLENIALKLQGKVIPSNIKVPTADGAISSKSWAITFDQESSRTKSIAKPEFRKVRIYLNQDKNRLNITAMQPIVLSEDSFSEIEQALPTVLRSLWLMAYNAVPAKRSEKIFNNASCRSLCMWANFLNSMLLLTSFKKDFFEEIAIEKNNSLDWVGPHQDDLRLLIGNDLAEKSEKLLSKILQENPIIEVPVNAFLEKLREKFSNEIGHGEKIPVSYKKVYEERLKYLVSVDENNVDEINADDVLRAIFHAQHYIEVLSRAKPDEERLDFGLTYQRLSTIVHRYSRDTQEDEINFCFDRLIDEGCIVPRYINMSNPDQSSAVWVRAFRVGEATNPKIGYVVKALFDSLDLAYGNTGIIPCFLLEKYCVLALNSGHNGCSVIVSVLNETNLDKGFDVEGARCVINPSSKKQDFLLDWAVSRKFLIKEDCKYKLDPDIEYRIESEASPLYEDDMRAVQDMANFFKLINGDQDLVKSVLTLLTSAASEKELQIAVEEEMRIWIHGNNSIMSCIQSINILLNVSYSQESLRDTRNQIDNLLGVIREAKYKEETSNRKQEIFDRVEQKLVLSVDNATKYMWRDLKKIFERRATENHKFKKNQSIACIFHLADLTNQVINNFLLLLENSQTPIDDFHQSIRLLNQATLDISDIVISAMCFEKNVKYVSFIQQHIAATPYQDNPQEIFSYLKPALNKIAELSEKVWTYLSCKIDKPDDIINRYRYIIKWDKRKSTACQEKDKLRKCISSSNKAIEELFGAQIESFNPTRDDGCGFICDDFDTVLAAFKIITDEFQNIVPHGHRFGCHYFEIIGSDVEKGFEYAARIMDFFKEIADANGNSGWQGEEQLSEPNGNYLIVSESVQTQAKKQGKWRQVETEDFKVYSPQGRYTPGLNYDPDFPISIITSVN